MGQAWRNRNPVGHLRFLELKPACGNLVEIVVDFTKCGGLPTERAAVSVQSSLELSIPYRVHPDMFGNPLGHAFSIMAFWELNLADLHGDSTVHLELVAPR